MARYVQRFYAYLQNRPIEESRFCSLLTDNHSKAGKLTKEIFGSLPSVIRNGHSYSQWAMGGYKDERFTIRSWYHGK